MKKFNGIMKGFKKCTNKLQALVKKNEIKVTNNNNLLKNVQKQVETENKGYIAETEMSKNAIEAFKSFLGQKN